MINALKNFWSPQTENLNLAQLNSGDLFEIRPDGKDLILLNSATLFVRKTRTQFNYQLVCESADSDDLGIVI